LNVIFSDIWMQTNQSGYLIGSPLAECAEALESLGDFGLAARIYGQMIYEYPDCSGSGCRIKSFAR
jgi:hypothetical protein